MKRTKIHIITSHSPICTLCLLPHYFKIFVVICITLLNVSSSLRELISFKLLYLKSYGKEWTKTPKIHFGKKHPITKLQLYPSLWSSNNSCGVDQFTFISNFTFNFTFVSSRNMFIAQIWPHGFHWIKFTQNAYLKTPAPSQWQQILLFNFF